MSMPKFAKPSVIEQELSYAAELRDIIGLTVNSLVALRDVLDNDGNARLNKREKEVATMAVNGHICSCMDELKATALIGSPDQFERETYHIAHLMNIRETL